MSRSTSALLVLATLLAVIASACGESADAGPPISAEARKEAQTLYQSLCATCHGQDGRGGGPGAAALTPKPRDYSDRQWQNSVTDEEISKTILLGGQAVGKSAAMPPQPQLKSKPEVVRALVEIIRGFGR